MKSVEQLTDESMAMPGSDLVYLATSAQPSSV